MSQNLSSAAVVIGALRVNAAAMEMLRSLGTIIGPDNSFL